MSASRCFRSASEAPRGNEWVWCVCASRPIGTHDATHSADTPQPKTITPR